MLWVRDYSEEPGTWLSFPEELNHQITKGTGGNRTRLNIIADILEVAMDEPLKTHIMYRANLSHAQLNSYLNRLVEMSLLAVVEDPTDARPRYRVTEKGFQFLKDYARLNRLLGE
jgi:predicted transcriptional regulator